MIRSRLGSFTAVPAAFDPAAPDPAAPLPFKPEVPPAASLFRDCGACAEPAAVPTSSRAVDDALDPLLPPLHAVSASGPATSSASKPAAAPARRRLLRKGLTI